MIEEGLNQVRARISKAIKDTGRNEGSVSLLAASKRTDADGVREAYRLGHRIFGENRAQSLRDKFDAVHSDCPDAEWHFIGHLQKNKVKYVVGRARVIHTIDSLELAKAISDRIIRQRQEGDEIDDMRVMVQVKFGEEETKTGTASSDALNLCHQVNKLSALKLEGLMTIPPLHGAPSHWFKSLKKLALQGSSEGLNLKELSMGMSSDMEEAIACGSTIVRLGTAIFQPKT